MPTNKPTRPIAHLTPTALLQIAVAFAALLWVTANPLAVALPLVADGLGTIHHVSTDDAHRCHVFVATRFEDRPNTTLLRSDLIQLAQKLPAGTDQHHIFSSDGDDEPSGVVTSPPPKPEPPKPAYEYESGCVQLDNLRTGDSGARFTDFSGEVLVFPTKDRDDERAAEMEMVLECCMHVLTGGDSSAIISYADLSTFIMPSRSEVILDCPSKRSFPLLRLVAGNIWVNFKKMLKDGTLDVTMNQAVTSIKSTKVVFEEDGTHSTVKVIEGVVEVTAFATGEVQLVHAGEALTATASGFAQKRTFDVAAETRLWQDVTEHGAGTVAANTQGAAAANVSCEEADHYWQTGQDLLTRSLSAEGIARLEESLKICPDDSRAAELADLRAKADAESASDGTRASAGPTAPPFPATMVDLQRFAGTWEMRIGGAVLGRVEIVVSGDEAELVFQDASGTEVSRAGGRAAGDAIAAISASQDIRAAIAAGRLRLESVDRVSGERWSAEYVRATGPGAAVARPPATPPAPPAIAPTTMPTVKTPKIPAPSSPPVAAPPVVPAPVEQVWVPVGKPQKLALDTLGAVGNGPRAPSRFRIDRPMLLTALTTYHWNNGRGSRPGLVLVEAEDGTRFGPWQARGRDGQGGVPNAYWETEPWVVLPPGSYVVLDSNPATWATNAEVGWRGIFTATMQAVRAKTVDGRPVAPGPSLKGGRKP